MRRFSSLLLWCVLAVVAETGGIQSLPATVAGSNLLSSTNSGLEPGHGWSGLNGTTIKTVTGVFRSGTQSLAISATGTGQGVNITVPTSWKVGRVRFWVKTSGDPGSSAKIFTYVFDATHSGMAYSCGGSSHKLSMSGGLSDWTEYRLCDEITESALHYGCSLQYRILVDNLANGVTVYVDDVEIAPLLEPLIIFPSYPNYRGMLWPDQGTTMNWAAAVEPPGTLTVNGLKVTVDVTRVSDGVVIGTVTDDSLEAVRTSGQWAHFSVNWMSYDASSLPDGTYYLQGKLRLKADNSVVYSYPNYKIVKEPASVQRDSWRVWVDRENRARFKRSGDAGAAPQFVHGAYLKNTGSTTTMGGADCCVSGDLVADNHRNMKLGCNHGLLKVSEVSNANPAVATVYGHSLSDHEWIQIAGATGVWTGLNGCYYWMGCPTSPAEIHATGPNTITLPLDTTSFGSFSGQTSVTLYRANCKSDEVDTAFPVWDRRWSSSGATVWRQMANWGMNLTVRYGNWASATGGLSSSTCTYTASADYASAYHAAIQDFNIWNLQIVNHYASGMAPISWWEANCNAGQNNEQKVRYAVNKFASLKPQGDGFAGFYVADEPNIWAADQWGNTFQTTNATFCKVDEHRSLNSGGVTFWATTTPGQANVLWNALVDVHGADPYPVGVGAIPDDAAAGVGAGVGQKRHGRTWWWTHMLGAGVFSARPYWAVLQLFTASSQYPTQADNKIQAVSALAAGATGILWWQFGASGLNTRTQSDYDSFDRVAKMIAELSPVLVEPIRDLAGRADGESDYGRLISSVSDSAVKCSSRQKGSRILLACANTTNTGKSVTITMTSSISGKVVRGWDNSVIAPSGPQFSDTFKGLLDASAPQDSVHVYLIEMQPAAMAIRPVS